MQINTHRMDQPARESVRPINQRANAVFLKIAGGRFRAWSKLRHVGRRSGREYVTPITAFPLGEGFVIALLYGDAANVDWCLNVMAAGKCTLTTLGREYVLEKPEIIPASEALRAYPMFWRLYYRANGISQFLWAHRQSEAPE